MLLLRLSALGVLLGSRAAEAAAPHPLGPPRATIEPYCDDALRIRVTPTCGVPHGPSTVDASAGALQPTCGGGPPVAPPPAGSPVTNGNLYASLVGGVLNVRAVDTGVALLSGPLPTFGQPSCGGSVACRHGASANTHSSFNVSFATPSQSRGPPVGGRVTFFGRDRVYGLGQLEGPQGQCADDRQGQPVANSGCGTPLNRRTLGEVPITSIKYHIAIPWLYSTAGFGVFFNQPGDGLIKLNATGGGINASFSCQFGLDMLVITAPAGSASPHTDIYRQYMRATGFPSPLPQNAALYWQSKDACKSPWVCECCHFFESL